MKMKKKIIMIIRRRIAIEVGVKVRCMSAAPKVTQQGVRRSSFCPSCSFFLHIIQSFFSLLSIFLLLLLLYELYPISPLIFASLKRDGETVILQPDTCEQIHCTV